MARLRDYKYSAVAHCAGIWENFGLWFKSKKKLSFSLLQFYGAAKATKKRLLKLTKHSEFNSFTNMNAEIDIDALKI